MNDFIDAQTFNELITMHGTTMLFLAALPIYFGFFNYISLCSLERGTSRFRS